jgi:hypothetical protein
MYAQLIFEKGRKNPPKIQRREDSHFNKTGYLPTEN